MIYTATVFILWLCAFDDLKKVKFYGIHGIHNEMVDSISRNRLYGSVDDGVSIQRILSQIFI